MSLMLGRMVLSVATLWLAAWRLPATALAQAVRADRVGELIARGTAHEMRGDPTSAIAFYRDAVAAGPRDARAYAALGEAYLGVSEWLRAEEAFEAGLRAGARSEDLWFGLYQARVRSERKQDALEALESARALSPTSVRVLEALRELGTAQGQWSLALAATRALLLLSSPPAVRELELEVRALELLLGTSERVRVHPCPAGSAVMAALAGCR